MAFAKSVQATTLGFGAGVSYKREDVALTATTTVDVQAAGSFSPPISRGKYRIRQSVANAATTFQLKVTATDGTTTVVLANYPANAAGELCDMMDEFATDLNLTKLSFICTLGGATTTTTIDVEVVGVQ